MLEKNEIDKGIKKLIKETNYLDYLENHFLDEYYRKYQNGKVTNDQIKWAKNISNEIISNFIPKIAQGSIKKVENKDSIINFIFNFVEFEYFSKTANFFYRADMHPLFDKGILYDKQENEQIIFLWGFFYKYVEKINLFERVFSIFKKDIEQARKTLNNAGLSEDNKIKEIKEIGKIIRSKSNQAKNLDYVFKNFDEYYSTINRMVYEYQEKLRELSKIKKWKHKDAAKYTHKIFNECYNDSRQCAPSIDANKWILKFKSNEEILEEWKLFSNKISFSYRIDKDLEEARKEQDKTKLNAIKNKQEIIRIEEKQLRIEKEKQKIEDEISTFFIEHIGFHDKKTLLNFVKGSFVTKDIDDLDRIIDIAIQKLLTQKKILYAPEIFEFCPDDRFGIPIKTKKGLIVQSWGEKLIADFLDKNNIGFEYDELMILEGNTPDEKGRMKQMKRPDFYLNEFNIIIEYFGMAGNNKYDLNTKKKKRLYAEAERNYISVEREHLDKLEEYLTKKLKLLEINI